MAEIRLRLRDADGDLPPVCMCCGDAATVTKARKMSWFPSWVYVLVLVNLIICAVVAMILTKRARVQAPLCDKHQGHWFYRSLVIWLSFFFFGFVGLAALILPGVLAGPLRFRADDVMPFACIASGAALV